MFGVKIHSSEETTAPRYAYPLLCTTAPPKTKEMKMSLILCNLVNTIT